MKKLLTKAPHGTRRTLRRFAWFPKEVLGVDGEKYSVWLESYEEKQFYAAYGYSNTGYDYTPRGWHRAGRHELTHQL
tara:strand:- start:2851 stop:3081 length:231 start_codon:yes stop_codon:yes gene_type:complete